MSSPRFAGFVLLACGVLSGRTVAPLPLLFEETGGGAMARTPGGAVAIAPDGVLLKSRGGAVRLKLENSRAVKPVVEDRLGSVANYITGTDKSMWRLGVPHYAHV